MNGLCMPFYAESIKHDLLISNMTLLARLENNGSPNVEMNILGLDFPKFGHNIATNTKYSLIAARNFNGSVNVASYPSMKTLYELESIISGQCANNSSNFVSNFTVENIDGEDDDLADFCFSKSGNFFFLLFRDDSISILEAESGRLIAEGTAAPGTLLPSPRSDYSFAVHSGTAITVFASSKPLQGKAESQVVEKFRLDIAEQCRSGEKVVLAWGSEANVIVAACGTNLLYCSPRGVEKELQLDSNAMGLCVHKGFVHCFCKSETTNELLCRSVNLRKWQFDTQKVLMKGIEADNVIILSQGEGTDIVALDKEGRIHFLFSEEFKSWSERFSINLPRIPYTVVARNECLSILRNSNHFFVKRENRIVSSIHSDSDVIAWAWNGKRSVLTLADADSYVTVLVFDPESAEIVYSQTLHISGGTELLSINNEAEVLVSLSNSSIIRCFELKIFGEPDERCINLKWAKELEIGEQDNPRSLFALPDGQVLIETNQCLVVFNDIFTEPLGSLNSPFPLVSLVPVDGYQLLVGIGEGGELVAFSLGGDETFTHGTNLDLDIDILHVIPIDSMTLAAVGGSGQLIKIEIEGKELSIADVFVPEGRKQSFDRQGEIFFSEKSGTFSYEYIMGYSFNEIKYNTKTDSKSFNEDFLQIMDPLDDLNLPIMQNVLRVKPLQNTSTSLNGAKLENMYAKEKLSFIQQFAEIKRATRDLYEENENSAGKAKLSRSSTLVDERFFKAKSAEIDKIIASETDKYENQLSLAREIQQILNIHLFDEFLVTPALVRSIQKKNNYVLNIPIYRYEESAGNICKLMDFYTRVGGKIDALSRFFRAFDGNGSNQVNQNEVPSSDFGLRLLLIRCYARIYEAKREFNEKFEGIFQAKSSTIKRLNAIAKRLRTFGVDAEPLSFSREELEDYHDGVDISNDGFLSGEKIQQDSTRDGELSARTQKGLTGIMGNFSIEDEENSMSTQEFQFPKWMEGKQREDLSTDEEIRKFDDVMKLKEEYDEKRKIKIAQQKRSMERDLKEFHAVQSAFDDSLVNFSRSRCEISAFLALLRLFIHDLLSQANTYNHSLVETTSRRHRITEQKAMIDTIDESLYATKALLGDLEAKIDSARKTEEFATKAFQGNWQEKKEVLQLLQQCHEVGIAQYNVEEHMPDSVEDSQWQNVIQFFSRLRSNAEKTAQLGRSKEIVDKNLRLFSEIRDYRIAQLQLLEKSENDDSSLSPLLTHYIARVRAPQVRMELRYPPNEGFRGVKDLVLSKRSDLESQVEEINKLEISLAESSHELNIAKIESNIVSCDVAANIEQLNELQKRIKVMRRKNFSFVRDKLHHIQQGSGADGASDSVETRKMAEMERTREAMEKKKAAYSQKQKTLRRKTVTLERENQQLFSNLQENYDDTTSGKHQPTAEMAKKRREQKCYAALSKGFQTISDLKKRIVDEGKG